LRRRSEMGIIYDKDDYINLGEWSIEARTKSIRIFKTETPDDPDDDCDFEISYRDLDGLQSAVGIAQQVRRDR
jgi:hypothetical protein